MTTDRRPCDYCGTRTPGRTVLDLYDAARNVPTFTYAKAAADLLTAARKAHAA